MRIALAVVVCSLLTYPIAAGNRSQNYQSTIQEARTAYRDGQFAAAQKKFREALLTIHPADERTRALVLVELGDAYLAMEDLTEGERAYQESLTLYKRLSREGDAEAKFGVPILLRNLGALYSLQGRDKQAIRVLEESLKLTKDDAGSSGITALALNGLGIVYFRQGKIDKAEDLFDRSLHVIKTADLQFQSSEVLNNLGAVYHAKRDYKKAEDFMLQALAAAQDEFGSKHPELIHILSSLGGFYTERGKYTEAETCYLRLLEILKPHKTEFEGRIARALQSLSRAYNGAGRKIEADAVLEEASILARRNLVRYPYLADIVEDYSAVLKKQGETGKAEELRTEARRARIAAGMVVNAHTAR